MNTRLNIALIPPNGIAQEAIRISRDIASKHEVFFTLDGTTTFPHLTVYSVEFPEKNISAIQEELDRILTSIAPVDCLFKDIEPVIGWIGINIAYSSEVRALHSTIVEAINPFREGYVKQAYLEQLKTNIPEYQKMLIQEYGRPTILNDYIPHLTLTRLIDEQEAIDLVKKLHWTIKDFKCDTIGVFKSAEHGTCTELLSQHSLR